MKKKIIALIVSAAMMSASLLPVYGAGLTAGTGAKANVENSASKSKERPKVTGLKWAKAPDTNIYYRGVDTRIEPDGSVSCLVQGGSADIRYSDGVTMTTALWGMPRYDEEFSRAKLNYSGTGHPPAGTYQGTIHLIGTPFKLSLKNIVIKNPDEMPTIKGSGKKDVYAAGGTGNVRFITGSGTKYKISKTFDMYGSSIYIYKMDKDCNLKMITSTSKDGKEICTLEPNTVYYMVSGTIPGFGVKEKVTYKVTAVTDKTPVSKCKISMASTAAYTGKAITPDLKVSYGKKALKKGTDYTATYSRNKSIGTASVTIKGKGKYTGSVTKTFKIVPARPAIQSAKKYGSTAVKLTWKKSAGASTYVIYRSTDGKKWTKAATTKASGYTDKGLKKGRSYKYRIRACRKVSGKNYYSSYSSVKTVK